MNWNDLDLETLKTRVIRVEESNSIDPEDLKRVYLKDVKRLLKIVDRLMALKDHNESAIKGAHVANDKMQQRKYRMIGLLTAVDAILPEPANPKELPDDYLFEVPVKWGLIKSIRNLIKGT